MRDLLQTMINALLSADADAVVGAEWDQRSPDRTTRRNGYRHRDLDTRVGTLDIAVPKLRTGTYFPDRLLERRMRAESALITVVDAEWGQRSPDVTTRRNGYRHCDLETRVGTLDIAVPKLRTGTYFPDWLLERRKRAESALITVVAHCYLAGVSTRRMDKLVI